MMSAKSKYFWSAVGCWLLIWQGLSWWQPFLPGPLAGIRRLVWILQQPEALQALSLTVGRLVVGLFSALLLGSVLAVLVYRHLALQYLCEIPLRLFQTMPVVMLILVLVMFVAPHWLTVLIPLTLLLPVVYTAVSSALKNFPRAYQELIFVFRIDPTRQLWRLYLPAVLQELQLATRQAVGLAVKSAIAAEVLTLPAKSIGRLVYEAGVYLDLDSLLAWAILLVTVEWFLRHTLSLLEYKITEYLGSAALSRLEPKSVVNQSTTSEQASCKSLDYPTTALVCFDNVSFSYDQEQLLERLSFSWHAGQKIGITAPTGQGKTTLIRLLIGLEKPQHGHIVHNLRAAVVFQDNRLPKHLTLLNQVMLVSRLSVVEVQIILQKCGFSRRQLRRLPQQLSGGMLRSLCLARALAADSELLILDEPFNGMDDTRKRQSAELIKQTAADRIIVLISHNPADFALLDIEPCTLESLSQPE